jgi:hypothetical protein
LIVAVAGKAATPKKAAKSSEPAKPKSDKQPAAEKKATEEKPTENVEEDVKTDYPSEDEYITPPNVEGVTSGLSADDEFSPSTLFPLLNANEIEIRVGQIFDWGVTLLLYKDARCDLQRLDSVCGPFGWQKAYQTIDGRLYCIVSIKDPETGEWVSKSDVGTESNTEAEKGQASDAFKRACVCWGSGRELYSAPEIIVKSQDTRIEKNTKGKLVCKDAFSVKSIGYDENRNIVQLTIVNSRGNVVFKYNK